ncbi:hypothetical protein PMAYCL1PPCAC_26041, partial [Pristionchus mayeri]
QAPGVPPRITTVLPATVMQLSDSRMTLSTTPIGAKQSMIDLRAGAILREKHARSASYRGCPVWVLLTIVLFIKTALIVLWLAREYESLNIGCVANSFNDTLLLSLKRKRDLSEPNLHLHLQLHAAPIRLKRSASSGNRLRAQASIRSHINHRSPPISDTVVGPRSQHDRSIDYRQVPHPTYVVPAPANAPPISTMVTTTKTDDLPSDSEVTVRMKTIRSRTETIHLLDRELAEAADEMKAIHVTPIMARFPEQKIKDQDAEEEEEEGALETTTKRRKGLGRKKQRKEEAERRRKMMESTAPPPSSPTSEQTKSPRHLLTSQPTTAVPTSETHRSSFLHGAIDPEDPNFTNKGEIRAYPAQVASRRPKGHGRKKGNKIKSNLSKDVSLLWMMNETQYDLYTSTAKTPLAFDDDEEDSPSTPAPVTAARPPSPVSALSRPSPEPIKPAIQTITIPTRSVITDELLPSPSPTTVPLQIVETAYDLWRQSIDRAASAEGVTERGKLEQEKLRTESPSMPRVVAAEAKVDPSPSQIHSPAAVHFDEEDDEPIIITHGGIHVNYGPAATDAAPIAAATIAPTISTPPVLHGLDRSRDADILAGRIQVADVTGLLLEKKRAEAVERERERERERMEEERRAQQVTVIDFQTQLASFASSTLCIARNLFVMWCILEVLASLPFLAGIIAGRRSLFVPTIVVDFLLMLVGGIFCLTIVFFAPVVYLTQGEMPSSTLLEWLVFAFLIVGGLVPIGAVFYLTFQAINILVDTRRITRFDDYSDGSSPEQRLL